MIKDKFAITGIGGSTAQKHLRAIKENNGELAAALDPHDSVSILDSYFPEAAFFTEFERFDRHLEKIRRGNSDDWVKYLSICSPTHLHDAHARLALRLGMNAICEQPLSLNPWNLDAIQEIEAENAGRVYLTLLFRCSPVIKQLKHLLDNSRNGRKFRVSLTSILPAGVWYKYSWKGMKEKSGGIATELGINYFDVLIWLFGEVESSFVHYADDYRAGGFLELKSAEVGWYFSIDKNDLPENKPEFHSFNIDGEEVLFNTDRNFLYKNVYQEILAGRGFGIDDARASIKLVNQIRNSEFSAVTETAHPAIKKLLNIEEYSNELL